MNGRNKNSPLCTGLSLRPIPLFLHLTPSYCPDSWLIGFTVGRRKSEKVVRWGNKWEQLTRINQSTSLCRYLTWQMEILCWFKRYCLDYFKIDLENRPQLALHHLLLDFHPFLHSHSCCSSQPITRIFLQLVEAGLGLPWYFPAHSLLAQNKMCLSSLHRKPSTSALYLNYSNSLLHPLSST